jgi:phosphatidate cytidylyltransferase
MADGGIMHRQRILSALLLIPLFLLLVQFGSLIHFVVLMGLVIGLAAWEFSRLCPLGTDPCLSVLIVLGALLWYGAVLRTANLVGLLSLLAGMAMLRAILVRGELRVNVLQAAWMILGVAYVGGLLSFPSLLRGLDDGRQYIYYLAFTTWAGDTGAFYVGSRLGHRLLCPRISPRKTVEGAVGGILATVLLAIAGSGWIWPRLPWGRAAVVGFVLAIVGIAGDLCESAVKRAASAKDSGGIIPGHGGILDRLDSLMFTGPLLYVLIWIGWV